VDQRSYDLTPSPRVLKMLGQVDFKPWQCLAELIDNSVDAFLSSKSEGLGYMWPQVTVDLPDNNSIRAGSARIKIVDNGGGMGPSDLEKAVKAGYSGNNSVDKLGLFGMGFNVATARLGQRTEVWTTRMTDDRWWGVAIDFEQIEREGFQVPALTRTKTPSESDRHGTEVIISKLDKDRARYLNSGGGISATRRQLGRVYNKIMRDEGLVIVVGGQQLEAREFCVWDQKRAVDTHGWAGRVPARIPIEHDFGPRFYCEACWQWLDSGETNCPACGSTEDLQERRRTVTGWIGIQRFFDKQDFGINLIRNGRIIEERSKAFFRWENLDGDVVPEYPLEATHWGGRIVGELELGFVPLASHQKDSFDHNSAEWTMIYNYVHGEGPILPERRTQLGFSAPNESPIARLHTAYRRGSPAGLRYLVPGDSVAGKGINSEPQQWAARFWDGDPEYQSDEIWWKAVVAAEEARNKGKGATVPDVLQGDDLLDGLDAKVGVVGTDHGDQSEDTTKTDPVHQDLDPVLSGQFTVAQIPGCPTLRVETSRLLRGRLSSGLHMEFAASGNRALATYDPTHSLFTESLVEPVDCLVQELAYQFLNRSQVAQSDWGISRIVDYLRQTYFTWSLDTIEAIEARAESFISELTEAIVENLVDELPIAHSTLGDQLVQEVENNVLRRLHQGKTEAAAIIGKGEFPRYLASERLPDLVARFPWAVTDSRFFVNPYSGQSAIVQSETVTQICNALQDVLDLASDSLAGLADREKKARLERGIGSLNLLLAWRS
jgi:hypothetical protein